LVEGRPVFKDVSCVYGIAVKAVEFNALLCSGALSEDLFWFAADADVAPTAFPWKPEHQIQRRYVWNICSDVHAMIDACVAGYV
jgi:hypothetical protein